MTSVPVLLKKKAFFQQKKLDGKKKLCFYKTIANLKKGELFQQQECRNAGLSLDKVFLFL